MTPAPPTPTRPRSPTRSKGDLAEERALAYLQNQGLRLIERNAASRLGEIDLIMRDGEAIVFIEVRSRIRTDFGGAAASVNAGKQRRVRREAQRWLKMHFGDRWPVCRFDVFAFEGREARIDWIRDAF
jgi:putative endonuclease